MIQCLRESESSLLVAIPSISTAMKLIVKNKALHMLLARNVLSRTMDVSDACLIRWQHSNFIKYY